MQYITYFSRFISIIILLLTSSCNTQNKTEQQHINERHKGNFVITADINLRYILEQLASIYHIYYPDANISFKYTTEDDAVSNFKLKKNDIIAVEKLLSPDEIANAQFHHQAKVLENIFAYDAIAIISNKQNSDSIFILDKLENYLNDKSKKIVFDNKQSGIAKQLMQYSNTSAEAFKNAYAVNSVNEVLQFIEHNNDAIGFIPYNSFSNRNEKTAQQIRTQFNILPISYHDTMYTLSQESIATQNYPLIRPIVLYIGNCPELVAQGFANFIFGKQISKALLLSGLVPKNIPIREVIVTEEFHPNKK